jgi:hypothetical protein
MERGSRFRLSPALAVAIVALVVALGGTAVAATSVLVSGDSLIKKNSLSGNRLRNHTITGTQINLSQLGKVPTAAKADTATTAASATNATNANHASSADTATNATNATTAATANALPAVSWHALTPINGWAEFLPITYGGSPQYTKDHEGFVHLSGTLTGTGAKSTIAAVLPAGFRPANGAWVPLGNSNGSFDPGPIDGYIDASGNIQILVGKGANGYFVSLEGAEFYVGN